MAGCRDPSLLDLDSELIVKNLYESGKTQKEIGAYFGVSQKVIWRYMKNHNIVTHNHTTAKMDMIGKTYGQLIVRRLKDISEYKDGKRPVLEWYCDCSCGNKNILVKGTELRAGRKTMCSECAMKLKREHTHSYFFKDITGNRYGKLVAIKPYYDDWNDNHNKSILWLCKCDCGREVIVSENKLQTGSTSSCGCLVSKGEERIRYILDLYNINYERQYKFDDLRNLDTNRRLKFDFAIFDFNNNLKFLLEYDGNQHVYGSRYSKDPEKNKQKFERLKRSDQMKNDYCDQHNIKLIRIDHKHFNDIYEIVFDNLLKEEAINWHSLK